MTLEGVISAVVTPFSADGEELRLDVLRALVERGIADGLDGVMVCGGTGEFSTLRARERRAIVEAAADHPAGRAAVVANVGATCSRDAVAHAVHAEAAGAAALMVATPYYEPIGPDEIVRLHREIAERTQLPLVVYNYPPAMGVRWTLELVERLVGEVPSVQYVKDSGGDLGFPIDLVRSGLPVRILAGEDLLAAPSLLLGCHGLLNGAANAFAPAFARMTAATRAGDASEAIDIARRIEPVLHALARGPYNGMVKALVGILGFDVGPLRAPYSGPTAGQIETLRAAVARTDRDLLSWQD